MVLQHGICLYLQFQDRMSILLQVTFWSEVIKPTLSSTMFIFVPISSQKDEDYSVLEAAIVHGYDPKDKDYSHLNASGKTS